MDKPNRKRKWLKVTIGKVDRESPLVLLIIVLSLSALFRARFEPLACLTNWIVTWDWAVYFSILCYYIFGFYRPYEVTPTQVSNSEDPAEDERFERKLGAEAVRAEITSNITVVGILLAGIAVFLRLGGEALRPAIVNEMYAAIGWLGGSAVIGLWNLSTATGLANRVNVAKKWWPTRLLNVAQFYAIIFGLLRFLIGMAALVQPM